MKTPKSPFAREPLPCGRLVRTALLLTAGLAGAAMAAPCVRDDCRNASRELAGPQVPLRELTVRSVDLGDSDAVESPAAAALSDSMAPLLYLTPRVASILEQVFDDTAPADDRAKKAAPAAPVADAEPASDEQEPYGPLSQADNAFQLPKFQRQMYRTDI